MEAPKVKDIKFIDSLLEVGTKLNINVDFYKLKVDKLKMQMQM